MENISTRVCINYKVCSVRWSRPSTVHVASAVGSKKIIALYGPTYIKASQPYETKLNQVIIITKNLPCSPCYGTNVIENCQDNLCMKEIVPSDIMDVIMTS